MRADEQVRCHRAARRRLSAVLAARLKSGDRPLSRPVPVGFGQASRCAAIAPRVVASPQCSQLASRAAIARSAALFRLVRGTGWRH